MIGIGKDIITERIRRGWSRKRLSELSGVTEGKIWRMEAKGNWTDDEIQRVESAFDGVEPPANTPARVVESIPLTPLRPAGTTTQSLETEPIREALPVLTWENYQDPRRPENAEFYLVSNSEAKTARRCQRKWWLTYYRDIAPKIESPLGAAAIGGRIHRALQYMYVADGKTAFDPREALEVLIIQDWTAVTTKFNEAGIELSIELRKKFSAEADLERAMISGYVQWLVESGEDSELKIIAAETYVEADITEDADHPTKLIGKLDVRTQRRRDNVRLFMDHKTVPEFSRPVQLLPIDTQMLHYHLLEFLSTEEGAQRCDGALYNMLKKSKRTERATPPFYKRVEVRHNQLELDNYKTQLLSTVGRIHAMTRALDEGQLHHSVAPPNPTRDCTWDCPFFQICPMFNDGSRVEDMIKQYFTQADPLSYYRDPAMISATADVANEGESA